MSKKFGKGAKICELKDLLFEVEIHENPRRTNKEYSYVVTGMVEDGTTSLGLSPTGEMVEVKNVTEMDLNYCSDVYALVKNADIFPNVERVLFNNAIDFIVEYKHINHVRFYADYVITDKRFGYRMSGTATNDADGNEIGGDVIQPLIRLQHSYNGLTKYSIVFGYYRKICSNGLTIPVAEMSEFNLSIVGKHTDVILHSLDKLNEMLINFAANARQITTAITGRYETLAERFVASPAERIEKVLKANGIIAVANSKFNTVADVLQRINKEANDESLGYNGKVNDWLVYNGINQYLNDDTLNISVPEVRREKDLKILEYMLTN